MSRFYKIINVYTDNDGQMKIGFTDEFINACRQTPDEELHEACNALLSGIIDAVEVEAQGYKFRRVGLDPNKGYILRRRRSDDPDRGRPAR